LYADLRDFNRNGDQPKDGDEGIVLEPLPRGKNTKMPDEYDKTIYAEIVGVKKPQENDKQGSDANAPLKVSLAQDAEPDPDKSNAEKGASTSNSSDETADSTKPKEQQNAVREEKDKTAKPTDSQQVQPPTKEDSGKVETHPEENSAVTKL
jgi:hypothetical protein